MKHKFIRSSELLWEIPLALLSFLFFKTNKLLLTRLGRIVHRCKTAKSNSWSIMDSELLGQPISLAVLLVNGPRWNTHAVIGLTLVKVDRFLEIDLESTNESAQPWTIVITNYSGAIITLGSFGHQCDYPWKMTNGRITLQLPKGQYRLALRYYNLKQNACLPPVWADGRLNVDAKSVSIEANNFYLSLRNRRNVYYLMLHFYVHVILRFQNMLPSGFVRSEYLPVGNPETEFMYGCMYDGEKLEILGDQQFFDSYDVYFNVYDRASFPVIWGRVDRGGFTTESIKGKGYYLIRICKLSLTDYDVNQLRVQRLC